MIVRIRNELCKPASPARQYRLNFASATAIVLAFILLARVSEYVVTKSNHFMRGKKHIMFLLSSGALVDSSWTHLFCYCIDNVVELHSAIKDSKNGASSRSGMFLYASVLCRSSSSDDTASFAWQGDAQHINNRVKKRASLCGFSELKKFHTHSLRIGRASALITAAGAPSWVIQLTGLWKSLVSLTYIRLASTAF